MPNSKPRSDGNDAESRLLLSESYFADEDFQYPEFCGSFDCETVEPVVADEFAPAILIEKEKKLSLRFSSSELKKLPSALVRFTEKTGENTIRLFSLFVSKFGFVFALPFSLLFSALRNLSKRFAAFLKSAPRDFSRELRVIRAELSAIKKGADVQNETNRVSLVSALAKYFVLSFTRHDRFWKTVFNTLFPLLCVAAVAAAFSSGRGNVLALDVVVNGEHLGYIERESTYENARSLALELLKNNVKDTETSSLLSSEPTYTLKKVDVTDLSSSDMVCEKLLSATGASLVHACGIYIDGEFLCAVRNESDASAVFGSIIDPVREKSDSDCIVAFVEEISYVQGLYPDDESVLWDSSRLKKTLREPKSEAEYYKTRKGDTALSVARENKLSLRSLKALNPNVDFSKKLKKNTSLLVKAKSEYVRVKVMKTRVTTKLIGYEKLTRESSSMLKGTKKVSQQGSYGEKLITTLVTYINGERTYSTVVSERTVKNPVDEITLVGTRSPYSGYYGTSYSYSGFIWPTRGAYSISSGYGYRSAYISGWSYHGGIDIIRGGGSSAGTPVIAAASGTVVTAYAGSTGYGNTVVIDHGNGYQTRYAHMLWGSITVYPGQQVYQGQQIGQIGSTGNSTGPHLHFEILKNGSKVNPLPYIA